MPSFISKMAVALTLTLACTGFLPAVAQASSAQTPAKAAPAGPTDPKAQKTYASGEDALRKNMNHFAAEYFHKANMQDGGHCRLCEERALQAAESTGDTKLEYECADTLIAMAETPKQKAVAHTDKGFLYLGEGNAKKKDAPLLSAVAEFETALGLFAADPYAEYGEGMALSHLNRDADARPHFEAFVKATSDSSADHVRAARFLDRPELARARMTPAFAVTTLDGKQISLDQLAGKVVLIDFWATWCGPCKEALPRVRELANKYQSQPFVVLSVSLDKDEQAWKDFVAKNNMTWPQYRDGGFDGRIAKLFNIQAIPSTFTVDTDGVLQDQHVGEADLEGKIKKLIARAQEMRNREAQDGEAERRPIAPVSEANRPAAVGATNE